MDIPVDERGGSAPRIRRRHVLFFGGFDPKGASWYHALYRHHAVRQSEVNGLAIEVGRRRRDEEGHVYWDVRASSAEGEACESRIEIVSWEGVVRRYWPRGGAELTVEALIAYGRVLGNGIPQILKLSRTAPRTLLAFIYPLVFFAFAGAAWIVLALLSGWAAHALLDSLVIATFVALAVAGASYWLIAVLDRRLDTSMLVRIYAFVFRYGMKGLPELERLVDDAGLRIAALAKRKDVDELLVVGYSMGSILATQAMGRALPAIAADRGGKPEIALLTLGNGVALVGLSRRAERYRRELATIASSRILRWIDVSSPADWASFAMLDPIEMCEVAVPNKAEGAPLMTSPRFHMLFNAESYRTLVRNKFEMHLQYLKATEKPGLYDYFGITAGPLSLRARYAFGGNPG